MSKKQRKSVQPIPEPIGIRTWIPKVGVLMVIVLAAIITFYSQAPSVPTHPQPTPAVVQSVAPVQTTDPGPTPEQEKWMREHFLHDCDRIAKTYPIEPIRQQFAAFVQRLTRKEVLMHCSAGYLNGTERDSVSLADQHEGKPMIQFFVPAVVDHYNKITDVGTRDDTIVGILLHEEFHLQHHVFTDRTGQDPKVFLPIEEGETWWWCVENLYLPMVRQGRLQHLPINDSVSAALRAYRDSRGNPNTAAWMQFAINTTCLKPPR